MSNQENPVSATDVLDTILEMTEDSSKAVVSAAEKVARDYANLAPAKRPAYLGIFLIILSVGIEFVQSLGKLISFSEVMLAIMLVSGVIVLILSSGLETWFFWTQLRQLEGDQRRISDERKSAFSAFFGSRAPAK